MGIRAIPVPMQVVSYSFPFLILTSIPILMGILWDSHSHWKSHSHGHFYYQEVECQLLIGTRIVTLDDL